MGRAPCCSKVGLNRGPWTPAEDESLTEYIQAHGEGHWRSLPKKAGLLRCGKSCRLRWMNYLKPDIKRGNITADEEDLIIRLHSLLGNRWSLIAGRLPGRTDNEIKNYWNTHLSKRLLRQASDPRINIITTASPSFPPKKKGRMFRRSSSKLEADSTKIHLPKPIRPTCPPCVARDSTLGIQLLGMECEFDRSPLAVLEHEGIHSDDSLEMLYEEYLQLLHESSDEKEAQLDSFLESICVTDG